MERSPAEVEEDRDFCRWYGAWEPYSPPEVARLLAGMPTPGSRHRDERVWLHASIELVHADHRWLAVID